MNLPDRDVWVVWPTVGEPNLMYDTRLYSASFVVSNSYYSFDLSLQDVKDIAQWCKTVIEHWEKNSES